MSENVKTKWYQVFFVLVQAPGLGDSPERQAIFTVFSTQRKEPLCGRLRVYLLNSAEQAFEMLAQNLDYINQSNFLSFIEQVVASDLIPSHNSEDLPGAELLENTEIGALVAITVWRKFIEKIKAKQAEDEAEKANLIPWGTGEKPKA